MTFTMPSSFPAFMATKTDGAVVRGLSTLSADQLPVGEVTVKVHWSSVNYKDALATLADGGVARISPLVAGVDLAGEVVAVDGVAFCQVGDLVLAHGYDIGTGRHGAYAEYCRLPASYVVALPHPLTARQAMAIGTAGFTAAQSVHALERHGLRAGDGPVLVTGATGGVGSTAVGMLSRRGYTVVASTGKATEEAFLRELGASNVIDRAELATDDGRPLGKERWAAVVDCVGGTTLATAIKTTKYGGAVAASGLTGGTALPTSVFPFILRGVALLGIDSVQLDMEQRCEIWRRCATDLQPVGLDGDLVVEIGLDGLEEALTTIRAGGARGRYVVRLA